MKNTHIEWNEALHEQKRIEKENQKIREEYEEMVDDAVDDMWEALGQKDFKYSDFEDICYGHGVDQDDVINQLI